MPEVTNQTVLYQTPEGEQIEEVLMTYSEEERQNIETNKANAKLLFTPEFIPIYTKEQRQYGLSDIEAKLYGFLRYFFANSPDNARFYFNNEDLSDILYTSVPTVTRTIKALEHKMGIKFQYKTKASGGTFRFIEARQIKLISLTHQIDESVGTPDSSKRLTNKNKNKINDIAAHKSFGWLEAIPEEDLKTLSGDFSFSYKETQEEARRAADWLRAKGRTYKDYRAFFRNWLRNAVRFRSEQKSVSIPRQISHDGFAI